MLLIASKAHSHIDLHRQPFIPFQVQSALLFHSRNRLDCLSHTSHVNLSSKASTPFVAEDAFLYLCCKLPFLLSKAIWNPPYRARVCILHVCSEDEHESIVSTWKRTTNKGTRDTSVCGISFFETPSVESRSKNGRGVAVEASHDGHVDEEDAQRRRLGRFIDAE